MQIQVFLLILLATLINAGAQVLLKFGMQGIGHFAFTPANAIPIGMRIATNPYIIAGTSCYVFSLTVWLLVLSRTEVSVAFSLASLSFIFTALAAWWLFDENLTPARLLGIGCIMLGVVLITRTA